MSDNPETPREHLPGASRSPEGDNAVSPHLSNDLLAAWVADELANGERNAAQRHLESCAHCQRALAETQRIRALVRAAASDMPLATIPSVADRVLVRLPKHSQAEIAAPDGEGRSAAPVTETIEGSARSMEDWARRNKRRDIWRRMSALAAVLLLIATSAMLFTRLGGRSPAVTSTFTPGSDPLANIPGNWAQVLPTRANISDVAVISPTDIWAVGWIGDDDVGGSSDVVLMHFDGTYWHRSPDHFPGAGLLSISMLSADEGWASGVIGAGAPFLLHCSGGRWRDARTTLTIPSPDITGMSLSSIHMVSATSGWMLAEPTIRNQTELQPTEVYQYLKVGARYLWQPIISWQGVTFNALSAISDHEIWLVGFEYSESKAIILHLSRDSNAQGVTYETRRYIVGDGMLSSVSMRSSTDGWAAGSDESNAGILFHWDGKQWSLKQFVQGADRQAGISGVVITGEDTGWVYSSVEGYLYSTADNQWFSYPLGDNDKIATGAAITPTAFLAIKFTTYGSGSRNPVPVPVIYSMHDGRIIPTVTPFLT